MEITPTNVNYFFTTLNTMFGKAYDATPTWYDKVTTRMPSESEAQLYGWVGMLETMRLWQGPRIVHTPAPQTYLVTNQPFELTQGIDKYKLADDQYGIYYQMMPNMALQAKKWPDYQLRDLLQNTGAQTGSAQNGLDTLAHWYASHPIDVYDSSKGTFCNDFGPSGVSVNGVTVGGYLNPTSYATLWAEFASRKAENGQPLGVTGDTILVPPQLDITAKTILQASFFGLKTFGGQTDNVGATENVMRGQSDIIMSGDLAAAPTTWYMLCTSRAIKPFIWQVRQEPQTVMRTSPQDPLVFDSHAFVFGVEARGAPAWSHAWLSARSGV